MRPLTVGDLYTEGLRRSKLAVKHELRLKGFRLHDVSNAQLQRWSPGVPLGQSPGANRQSPWRSSLASARIKYQKCCTKIRGREALSYRLLRARCERLLRQELDEAVFF